MTPEQRTRADALLTRLHEFCRDYEHGLPVYDDGKMAQMREIVEDWLNGPADSARVVFVLREAATYSNRGGWAGGEMVDTGDTVLHRPTGEHWTVAYVRDGRIAWLGWPQGEAAASDCEVIAYCTPEKRQKWLLDMAGMNDDSDPRCRYAKRRLADHPAEVTK